MGSRGPIGSVVGIRALKEARQTRKRPKAKPQEGKTIVMPPWLSPENEPFWARIVPELVAAGVALEQVDSDACGMYCLSLRLSAEAAVDAQTTTDPALRVRFMAKSGGFASDALKWGASLGATPAARARLGIKNVPPEPDDPWREF